MKGCVIAAPMTGSGKTTVTLGILSALRRRGVRVQPFKVGPDFIDPGLHELAAGAPSHNLDGWMMSRDANRRLFADACADAEAAIVEGVMGLFDGFEGGSNRGSTAEMAVWLGLPIVLVVDAHPLARSAAAIVQGFRTFDANLKIAGVILNRVGGEGHYRILADAITDTPILGWLPQNPAIEIPERHLGLHTAREESAFRLIPEIGRFVERRIDLDLFLERLPDISVETAQRFVKKAAPRFRVAVAHDAAFSFYYHANRMELQRAGAAITEFSPLTDRALPEADFLYIGGGYPELYRAELESNESMRRSVRKFIDAGKPFYAECGGLMYLAQSIACARMVGAIPTDIEMTDGLVDFGYCEVRTIGQSILGAAGTLARGHQFHYSKCAPTAAEPLYSVRQGSREYLEGFRAANGVASYIHLHFLSNPQLAETMLNS